MTDVAFDAAVGSASATWSHTNSDAGNAILVACRLGALAEARVSAVTYGGVSLTEIGDQVSFGDGNPLGGDGVIVFGKIGGLPTGANTVSVTGFNQWAGSCTYENAGSFGDVFKNINVDGGGDSEGELDFTGTEVGGICFTATSFGSQSNSTVPGTDATLRWGEFISGASGSGNGWVIDRPSEASTTAVGWSNDDSDWWGTVGVEIKPAGEEETVVGTGAVRMKKMRVSASGSSATVVAAYAFDEGSGSTIHDYSGNSRDMTIVGTNSWVTGKDDYPHAFQAGASGSDGAAFNNGSSISDLAGDVTLQFWYKSLASVPSTTLEHVGGLYGSAGFAMMAGYAYRSRSGIASSPHFTGRDSTSTVIDVGHNGSDIADNDWHNAAVVYHTSGLVETYLDGTQVASASPTTHSIGPSTVFLAVGSAYSGAAAQSIVQDMRIFDGALPESEILKWMNTPVHPTANLITGAIRMKKMRVSGTSTEKTVGTADIRMKKMRVSGTSTEKTVGTGVIRMKKMRVVGTSTERTTSTAAIRMKKMRVAGVSTEKIIGTGAIRMKKMRIHGSNLQVKDDALFIFSPL